MLPAQNRMRTSDDFADAIRYGKRSGNRTVVVHVARGTHSEADLSKVGFVVSKAVGNSVVRHNLTRKFRHIMRGLLPYLEGRDVVIRANPPAAAATSAELTEAIITELRRIGLAIPDDSARADDEAARVASMRALRLSRSAQ